MAITLTGTGGLFSRLGKIIGLYENKVTSFGTGLNTSIQGIDDQFASNDQIVIDGMFTQREQYRTVHNTLLSYLASMAGNTIVEQANRDSALNPKTLTAALTTLITQMKGTSDSIKKGTIGLTVTAGSSNLGDAVMIASGTNEFGDTVDMALAETVSFVCTADSDSGGTAYNETLSYTGQPARASTDYQWPGGSGASGLFRIHDPAATGNVVTDGGFESWTGTGSNTPVSWTVATGAAGTQVLRSTAVVRGDYSMRFVSDGSTLTTIRQAVTLSPNTVYGVSLWGKMSALDASGILRIRLCDGSFATISNDASTAQSYTRNLNGQIGTSYTNVTTTFQTPRQIPTTAYIEIGLTTSSAAAKTLDLDSFGFVPATRLYAGGPFVAAFSKANRTSRNDTFSLAVTNSQGTSTFVRDLDRLLGMRLLGLYLPSVTGSETVLDSLIS